MKWQRKRQQKRRKEDKTSFLKHNLFLFIKV